MLVDAVAQIATHGSDALRGAIAAELERAITLASAAPKPFGRKPGGQARIDIVLVSPGGVALKGRYHGKRYLSEILGCLVDEGHPLGILKEEPFATHFASVRDGHCDTVWFDFAQGQAGFAAVHPELSAAPLEKPDTIFAIFATTDRPDETRRDPEPKIAPIAFANLLRLVRPSVAKPPQHWQNAIPDRRVFKLSDGRRMSTRWYGAPNATPIIVFGAIHRSTMADAFLANAAIARGFALLVIERPGIGASDPVRELSYESVAEDVAEIVHGMGIKHAFVFASGTAASFGMATAQRLPEIVKAVALTSPRVGLPTQEAPSRYGRVLWALLKNSSGLDVVARLLRQMRILGTAQSLLLAFAVNNERDKRILNEQGMLPYIAAQTADAFEKSVEGGLREFRLYQSGAFFDPKRVIQPMRIWEGTENKTLSIDDTWRAFAHAPNVQIELIEGGGVLMDQDEADSIVRWLAQGWSSQRPSNRRV